MSEKTEWQNNLMHLCCLCRCSFTVEPSFAFCENLRFGRRSFKGFNPEIEVYYQYVLSMLCFHRAVIYC